MKNGLGVEVKRGVTGRSVEASVDDVVFADLGVLPSVSTFGSSLRLPLLKRLYVRPTACRHVTTAQAQTRYWTHLATSHDRGVWVLKTERGIIVRAVGKPRAEGVK